MRLTKLTSILGGAAILLHLGVAAPLERFQTSNILTRASTYYDYCTTDNLGGINAAVIEAKQMLAIAETRTRQLGLWLEAVQNGAVLDIRNEPALFQSTARTFEAIFGFVYFGVGQTAQNDAALDRVRFIYGLIGRFTQGLNTFWNNGNLEIYCADDWLLNTGTQYQYLDNRKTTSINVVRDFSNSGGICRDVPSYYGWVDPETENSPTSGVKTSVLTLCQGYIAQWTNNYLNGDTLTSLVGSTFATGSKSLDNFQGSTFTSGLLHELSHAEQVVGTPYLDDKDCTVGGVTVSAYGWNCISDLAQKDPDAAIGNADSWTYYITAMYFQNNDWSTGVANPI